MIFKNNNINLMFSFSKVLIEMILNFNILDSLKQKFLTKS